VEERRGDPGAEAELAELALLGVARLGHVLAVDRLASAKDLVEQRLAHGLARAAGEDHLCADSRHRQHLSGSRLFEDDRHPVERDEAAQLADERLESLVEIERRTEGTCAACRRLEDVGTAAQLVTEQFGLYDLRLRGRRLVAQPVDKPAHDHPGQGQQTPWEDDVVRLVAVGRIVESRLTPPFGEGEERGDRERHQQPAADPVADGRFDQQNEEELVDRRADLVLVDEDEGRDDDGVDVNPSRPISRGARAKPSQRLSRKKPTPTTASRPVVAQAQPS
jgi:hypothetical protein